ncbi:MAG: TonB-dependent receptor, partial [Blastocatellia bacterium]
RMYVLPNPGFPDPLSSGASLTGQPVSVTRLDPSFKMPYTIQYSIGIERQLEKGATLSVTYQGSRGIDRFRSRDINAPLPPLYLSRPDADFGVIRQIESSGRSMGESLEVSFRGRISKYFTGMAQYRLARAYDNTSGITAYPANNYDLTGEWSRSDWDRRHRFELMGAVSPGKQFNLGLALSLYTGAPYTETTGKDQFNDGVANDRPAGVSRNGLQGPGYADLDLRCSRDFHLVKGKGEKSPTLTVGLDAFNTLNQVNFTSFVGNLSSPFFGLPVSAQPPRRLQLSAKIEF